MEVKFVGSGTQYREACVRARREEAEALLSRLRGASWLSSQDRAVENAIAWVLEEHDSEPSVDC
jgi:hypothetical protein